MLSLQEKQMCVGGMIFGGNDETKLEKTLLTLEATGYLGVHYTICLTVEIFHYKKVF